MAFKMKGSAFKLNNVATKSALKHTESIERGKSATHEDHHEGRADIKRPPGGLKDSPVPMKSPLMTIKPGTCAICGGPREAHTSSTDHTYRMGQAESVQASKDKRKVELDAERAKLIEKYGSWEAAVAANEKRKAQAE